MDLPRNLEWYKNSTIHRITLIFTDESNQNNSSMTETGPYVLLFTVIEIFSHLVGLGCPNSEISTKLFKNDLTIQNVSTAECLSSRFPVCFFTTREFIYNLLVPV